VRMEDENKQIVSCIEHLMRPIVPDQIGALWSVWIDEVSQMRSEIKIEIRPRQWTKCWFVTPCPCQTCWVHGLSVSCFGGNIIDNNF
jgi:hypothetical protein